jgi:hypothetical protein
MEKDHRSDLPLKYVDALAHFCNFITRSGQQHPFIEQGKIIYQYGIPFLIPSGMFQTILLITFRIINIKISSYQSFSCIKSIRPGNIDGTEINQFFNKSVADSNEVYQWQDSFSLHGILPYFCRRNTINW